MELTNEELNKKIAIAYSKKKQKALDKEKNYSMLASAKDVQAKIDSFKYFNSINLELISLPPLGEDGEPLDKKEGEAYNSEAQTVTLLRIAEKYLMLLTPRQKKNFITLCCNPANYDKGRYIPKELLLRYADIYSELFERV